MNQVRKPVIHGAKWAQESEDMRDKEKDRDNDETTRFKTAKTVRKTLDEEARGEQTDMRMKSPKKSRDTL